jgi:hypothetical protein
MDSLLSREGEEDSAKIARDLHPFNAAVVSPRARA